MNEAIIGAAALTGVVAFLTWRFVVRHRHWGLGDGVRKNLALLTERLDALGVEYEVGGMIDGAGWADLQTDNVSGGAIALSEAKRRYEVAHVVVKVKTPVELDAPQPGLRSCMHGRRMVLYRTVGLTGNSLPRPKIKIGLTPFHCWGFDPFALTRWQRDPQFSEVLIELENIKAGDLASMTFPPEIIETAARFLAEELPENRIRMHLDSQWTEGEGIHEDA